MERKLNRLKDYDYSQAGAYFVTICTYDKICYFGDIENEIMQLNEYGEIAANAWKEILNHYNDIGLDEFIIMPNHVHGIIFLFDNDLVTEQCSVTTGPINKFRYGKLSKIVKSFKEAVTKQIRNAFNDTNFGWQRSFYDHIIRDEKGLDKIREYVHYNPLKWDLEKNEVINMENV